MHGVKAVAKSNSAILRAEKWSLRSSNDPIGLDLTPLINHRCVLDAFPLKARSAVTLADCYYNGTFVKQCISRIKHELLLLKRKLVDELLTQHLIHKMEEYGVITDYSDGSRSVCGYTVVAWCHQLI